MGLDVARIDRGQVGIEITGLRIGICPRIVRHVRLRSSLRSRGEQSQPMTIGQPQGGAPRAFLGRKDLRDAGAEIFTTGGLLDALRQR
jgi:hypothetical protein